MFHVENRSKYQNQNLSTSFHAKRNDSTIQCGIVIIPCVASVLCLYRSSSPISSNASLCTDSLPLRNSTVVDIFSLSFLRTENVFLFVCSGKSCSWCDSVSFELDDEIRWVGLLLQIFPSRRIYERTIGCVDCFVCCCFCCSIRHK